MTINGLENNYYLTQNDIWVKINGFTEVVSKIILEFKNLTTGEELKGFECSASPDNDCFFNVCFPIRALMPEPNHIVYNSLQNFQIKITAKFKNTTLPDEVSTITKYFIRGGRNKQGQKEWYLNDGDFLVNDFWISGGNSWTALSGPLKISSGTLVEDSTYSKETMQEERKACDGKVLKYLNSIGGYEYFYFDRYEVSTKTKPDKIVSRITDRLRKDNFQNIGYEETKTITFNVYTEEKIQSNFEELISSLHVLMYNPEGNDNDSKWSLLKLDDNTSVYNNYENAYENKATFTLPTFRTIKL
ncbi:hypothetical protein ACR1PO_15720 [Chryseobacterium sp. RRHN12]|uniref:hypothetical protein n=1 Tax=Chryseobacterium sp. RRHN12 TaxID=3437884 RepID=UPI003D9B5320